MAFQHLVLMDIYMRKIIIVCMFFIVLNTSLYAAKAVQKSVTEQSLVNFSAKKSEDLESESLESALELKVLQAKLDKITTQDKLNKASGGEVVFDNVYVNVLSITIFGNQKEIQLTVNGNKHEYNEGDYIASNLFVDKVNRLGVILKNKETGEVKHIMIDND